MSIDLFVRGQIYINETTGQYYYYGPPIGGGAYTWNEGPSKWDGSDPGVTATIGTLTGTTITGFTTVAATNFNGTLLTNAQPNVTSLGTLTSLTVDNITVNGATIDAANLIIESTSGDLSLRYNGTDEVNIDGTAVTIPTNALTMSDGRLSVTKTSSSVGALVVNSSSGSFTGTAAQVISGTSGSSSFNLCVMDSNAGADREFKFRGDGEGTCDGSWTGGGADFAEFMEWEDGNPDNEDRVGVVVTASKKSKGNPLVKPAKPGDVLIGVVSARPTVVGNSDWNKWQGKHKKDKYGRYLEGNREIAEDYDPKIEHIPRELRPEWSEIGIIGLVVIRDDQPTSLNWVNFGPCGKNVSKWLIK